MDRRLQLQCVILKVIVVNLYAVHLVESMSIDTKGFLKIVNGDR